MTNMGPGDLSGIFYKDHARRLCFSYEHWTGKPLIAIHNRTENTAELVFNAPFVLVSHGTENIPVFNFANRAALELFEYKWEEFIQLASNKSADLDNQEDRAGLMARVRKNGYEENCSGVRVSSSGKRFLIEGATVWNVIDEQGKYFGQAAMFIKWTYI